MMSSSKGNSIVVVSTLDSDNEWFNQHLQTTKPSSSKSAQQQVEKERNNNNTMGTVTANATGTGKGTAITTKPISPSPGRTRQTPIVVAGEDTIAPLIIVESRDISPDPRLRESQYTMHSNDQSTTEEEEEEEDEEVDKGNRRRHRRSRTLSPPSRTTTTRITPSFRNAKEEQLDTIIESITSKSKSNTDTPSIKKTATKESSIANSDAVTTPHTNRTSRSRSQQQHNQHYGRNSPVTNTSNNYANKTNIRSTSVSQNTNRNNPLMNNKLHHGIDKKDSPASTSESPNNDDDNDDDSNRDEGLQNLVSMTSSITSTISNIYNDYDVNHHIIQEKQHPSQHKHEQQQQPIANSTPKRSTTKLSTNLSHQQVKPKNLVPQPGTNRIQSKNAAVISTAKLDRSRPTMQHSRERVISKGDVSIVGEYPLTPLRLTSTKTASDRTTPNSLYEALDLNNNRVDITYSPFDSMVSPLSMNLSDVLRNSSSETASFFHDFHNPNIAVNDRPETKKSDQQTTTKVVARNTCDSSNFHKQQNRNKSQRTERHVSSQNRYQAAGHGLIDCEPYETMSSSSISSNKHDVVNHSILQLCTEDLMSDDIYLVHAAICRLHDVCCIVTDSKRRNHVSEKETSSIISTSSTSSTILNRIRFLKAGGHALIVGVMKKYPTNAPIQAASCRLIHQLILMDENNLPDNNSNIEGIPSSGNSNQNTSNRNGGTGAFNELFSAVYGMDCVIGALQRFSQSNSERHNSNNINAADDDDVYNLACGALVAIVCSTSKMIDRLLQHDTRYISIFIKAAHAPINQSTSGICRFIYYILKQYPQYVNEVVMAGGIEEVLDEMNQCPNSVHVQYCGCSAIGTLLQKNNRMILSSLSSSNNDVMLQQKYGNRSLVEYIVHELDGAHVIVKAMKTFVSIEDVQAKGVVALCNITTSSTTTAKSSSSKSKESESISTWIKQAGGLSAIGIALENFPNNDTIQNKGCLAIKTLLLDRASSSMVTSE